MTCEIVGGFLSGSLAIATDAAHILTDFTSFMISLFSIWMATRPATKRMPFGWYRAEVIGALTSVLLIWVVTGILVYMAIERIVHKEFEIDATIMLITSAFGVAVNVIMGLSLHQHSGHGGHSHGHGHSHNHNENHQLQTITKLSPKDDLAQDVESGTPKHPPKNLNVRAAYIHVIGDFIQSTGVLVAALIIYFKPEWNIVDPICTFLFSILVLATTYNIMKDTIMVLMEGMPPGMEFMDIMNTFMNVDGVVRVHNLRVWALSLDKTAVSAHLAIQPGLSTQNILQMATKLINKKYELFETTLQVEEFENDMENCNQCQLPN